VAYFKQIAGCVNVILL